MLGMRMAIGGVSKGWSWSCGIWGLRSGVLCPVCSSRGLSPFPIFFCCGGDVMYGWIRADRYSCWCVSFLYDTFFSPEIFYTEKQSPNFLLEFPHLLEQRRPAATKLSTNPTVVARGKWKLPIRFFCPAHFLLISFFLSPPTNLCACVCLCFLHS